MEPWSATSKCAISFLSRLSRKAFLNEFVVRVAAIHTQSVPANLMREVVVMSGSREILTYIVDDESTHEEIDEVEDQSIDLILEVLRTDAALGVVAKGSRRGAEHQRHQRQRCAGDNGANT